MPLPEAGLIGQGALSWHPAGVLVGRTPHALVALSAPDAASFRAAARDEARVPLVYKTSARVAVRLRREGFRVLPVAAEAWLDPERFTLAHPGRAGLRRKLRRAEAAGVTARIERQPCVLSLARINAAWLSDRGRERGFSMGRFAPEWVGATPIVVARQGAHVVGFATFLPGWADGRRVWTLDLMRPSPTAPDGTAQALILAAMDAARQEGIERLSLAAVPIGSLPGEAGLIARLGRVVAKGDGLWQFKQGFAPRWTRLYIAAPGWMALALGGAELAAAILRPRPIPGASDRPNMRATPSRDAEYEFALGPQPWQREGEPAS